MISIFARMLEFREPQDQRTTMFFMMTMTTSLTCFKNLRTTCATPMSDALDLFQFQHQPIMLIWLLSVLDTTCKLLWTMTGNLILDIIMGSYGWRSCGVPGVMFRSRGW